MGSTVHYVLSRVLLSSAVMLSLSACVENSGLLSRVSVTTSTLRQATVCPLPDAVAVSRLSRKLASASVQIGEDFCAKGDAYSCYRRIFSPDVANDVTQGEECASLPAFGGNACWDLKIQSYNTREAALLPETPAGAVKAGGEFNRSEYVCHHVKLKDGEAYLAVGDGESLPEALNASLGKCVALAPRLK